MNGFEQFVLRGHIPWTLHRDKADHEYLKPASQCKPIEYPEFFAMLAEIGRIRDEQGEDAAAAPEHAELFMKMVRAAPPRYKAEGDAILAEALPTATHVDDHGRPVYSAQQIADTLGVPVEAIEAGIQHMEDVSFSEGLHIGPVHLIQ